MTTPAQSGPAPLTETDDARVRAAADAAVDGKFPDPETRPTMSVDEARPFYGLSRSSMFNAVRNGDVPAIRVGGRWLLPTAAVRRQLGLDP